MEAFERYSVDLLNTDGIVEESYDVETIEEANSKFNELKEENSEFDGMIIQIWDRSNDYECVKQHTISVEEVEYTRVTVLTDSHVTATEKKHIIHVVNLNDDNCFDKWLNVNRKQYLIKKVECNVFEVTTRENRTSAFTGKAFTSDNTFKLKLA